MLQIDNKEYKTSPEAQAVLENAREAAKQVQVDITQEVRDKTWAELKEIREKLANDPNNAELKAAEKVADKAFKEAKAANEAAKALDANTIDIYIGLEITVELVGGYVNILNIDDKVE